jgi:hypothetical protein
MDIEQYISELLPVYRAAVVGRYAVALAGAHAKGHWDEGSDLDIFLLADGWKPLEERIALVEAAGGTRLYVEEQLDSNSWGSSLDFTYKGIPVETTTRSIQRMQSVVAGCAAGRFTVEPVLWTIHGYYDFVYLSEVSFLKPVDDCWGIIEQLKGLVEPYPQAFRQAAIDYFWPRANFWMDNFHYLSAIERADFVYTSGILQQSFHNLVQVLFPLNQRFFYGDKRLQMQLARLPFCPAVLREELDFLLGIPGSAVDLRRQRSLFMQALAETGAQIEKTTGS